jgi:hypothetical protein
MSDCKSPNPQDLARRIVDENARYNLGVVERTINVPMLALDFLGRRNRWRLSLQKRGEEQFDGCLVWAVTFSERERPTLVKTPQGRDRPARETVRIDPSDGPVLRTDLEFEGEKAGDSPAAAITVLYRPEVSLGLLVPCEMRETYRMRTGGAQPLRKKSMQWPATPTSVSFAQALAYSRADSPLSRLRHAYCSA